MCNYGSFVFNEGKLEGKIEGKLEGKIEGLVTSIVDMMNGFNITIDEVLSKMTISDELKQQCKEIILYKHKKISSFQMK